MDKQSKGGLWVILLLLSVIFVFVFYRSWWQIALPTLIMIGLHELGHLAAARYYGLKTGGFYFLPGLGGVALIKEWPQEHWKAFVIAYAGPLAGLAQVVVLMITNYFISYRLLNQLIVVWSAVNLFNLLMALPLDGGKMGYGILGSVKRDYLNSILYYIITLSVLLLIVSIAGLVWTFMIGFFGWQERDFFLTQETIKRKLPMTSVQILTAVSLYLSLVITFVWIIVAKIN